MKGFGRRVCPKEGGPIGLWIDEVSCLMCDLTELLMDFSGFCRGSRLTRVC